ncbi:MAG: MliC family protein, partial [Alphaproteobacteria bacterium]|nr:MliC family protein [Alphaproteobacteria bacterium]
PCAMHSAACLTTRRTAFRDINNLIIEGVVDGPAGRGGVHIKQHFCCGGDVTASYRCANGERLRVSYRSQDAAMITYRGETHFLPLARSASGARYAGDGWQWWIKGQAEGVLSRMPADVAVAPGAGVLCTAEMAVAPESQLRPPVKPAP